jgi:hypothetical protein
MYCGFVLFGGALREGAGLAGVPPNPTPQPITRIPTG